MGYRNLLAVYMRHVEGVLGTNLIEVAAMTSAVSERELGELRSIAAQLRRESFDVEATPNFNHVVRSLLSDQSVTLEKLAQIDGFSPSAETDEGLTDQDFSRILLNLLAFQSER